MLAKLELKLKCEKELTYQMSSLFHGALMELLPEKYADYLHISSLHPHKNDPLILYMLFPYNFSSLSKL